MTKRNGKDEKSVITAAPYADDLAYLEDELQWIEARMVGLGHKARLALEQRFDELCTTRTCFTSLNLALERMGRNKGELLLVLERPDIPLHNNLSEGDIREYVKRRKISGGTRSEDGRRGRDTFASLKKTCRKLGVSFWQYLADRLHGEGHVPSLPSLIEARAHPS